MDKTGHWILDSIVSMDNTNIKTFIYKCSECGFYTTSNRIDVCRHCGAKMNNQEKGKNGIGRRVMDKLKPCPFCGGDAEMEIKYGDYGYNPDFYSVKCKRCNAKIGKVSNNYADLSDDVVNAWNRRATDDT